MVHPHFTKNTSIILLTLITIDLVASAGFYLWYRKIYQLVEKCPVNGYGYDLYTDVYPTGTKYVCLPHVYVSYKFRDSSYEYVPTRVIDFKDKSYGFSYNQWNSSVANDCYSKIIEKYPMDRNIEYCYITIDTPKPTSMCVTKRKLGNSDYNFDESNGQCSYGYQIAGMVIAAMFVGIVLMLAHICNCMCIFN